MEGLDVQLQHIPTSSHAIMPTFIGIDISKKNFDVSINRKSRRFANTSAGFAALVQQLPSDAYCVMEATGTYGYSLAEYLVAHGYRVAVVNPLRIKRYGQMHLRRHKTDRADAALIAQFAANQQLAASDQWQPPSDALNDLKQQQTVLEQLKKQQTALLNQLESLRQLPRPSRDAIDAIQKVLAGIAQAIKELEASQERQICQTDKDLYLVIRSVPGIGPRAATALLIATNFFRSCQTSGQLASYLGLCPRPYQSGISINSDGAIGHTAQAYVRALLYMCSISAMRFNRSCHALYTRLLGRGRSKKVALIAVAHKLVRQVFAVVERRTFFVDVLPDNP